MAELDQTPKILDRITGPHNLKGLSLEELNQVATEVREEIIRVIVDDGVGGHFASNLGTVELAVALHHVFDTPHDRLVWDVGHQAYPHKLLTGRRDRFHTIRKLNGLSGFLCREESDYDCWGAGHATTSISAALGMAIARDITHDNNNVVAIIGDGAMTGGMAYEAFLNAGQMKTPFIVVLNDNEMSISPNVGALARYLNLFRTDPRYNQAKTLGEQTLKHIPAGDMVLDMAKRVKHSVKDLVIPTRIWEEWGFTYLGPIDGHSVADLVRTFEQAKLIHGPVFIHAHTVKGKGYAAGEADSIKWHSVSPKAAPPVAAPPPNYQDVFAQTMMKLAATDPRLAIITAAMREGTGLAPFAKAYPDRFFDVGIAEEHAVTFAGGMATSGVRPVCAIYSTFLQRGFDQIIHDICIQNLPVLFCMDRAGLVGDDGKTHQGLFDIGYLRMIPHMTVMAPKDENELQAMIYTALQLEGPSAIRYPRGASVGVTIDETPEALPIGKGEILRYGNDVTLVGIGSTVVNAVQAAELLAAEGIQATVVNARFVKPLDEALFLELSRHCPRMISFEENNLMTGFGSAILECFEQNNVNSMSFHRVGIPDQFVDQGPQATMRDKFNLSKEGMVRATRQFFPELFKSLPDAESLAASVTSQTREMVQVQSR